jgi:hypothetical protein
VLARNPLFYTLKQIAMRAKGNGQWPQYRLSSAWKKLSDTWRIETVSFMFTLGMELDLTTEGMARSAQPSTGYVAYRWLLRKLLHPSDGVDLAGFTTCKCT